MSARVTLNDVAQRAGVHYTTVSLALRNSPRIPSSTRKKICDLADEMGYRPDPVLRALISYRVRAQGQRESATLAYLTNGRSRFGWRQQWPDAECFAGAEVGAKGFGFRLEHFWLGEPGLSQARLSDILHSRGISGVIIGPNRNPKGPPIALDWQRFAAVAIENARCETGLHRVCGDPAGAVRLAVHKARAAGCSRLGFVLDDAWDAQSDGSWTSSLAIEHWFRPTGEEHAVFRATGGESSAAVSATSLRAFATWLNRFQPQVIISEQGLAAPYLAASHLAGSSKLPFIDLRLKQACPGIAGVIHNHRRVGEVAVEVLSTQLRENLLGAPPIPTTTAVQCTWSEGETLLSTHETLQLAGAV